MVISQTGKIGINTTDASHLFTVSALAGNTIIARFKALNQMSNFDIGTDASSNGQVYVRNNLGATKVKLNSVGASYFTGGNVGIGTDNQEDHSQSQLQIQESDYKILILVDMQKFIQIIVIIYTLVQTQVQVVVVVNFSLTLMELKKFAYKKMVTYYMEEVII